MNLTLYDLDNLKKNCDNLSDLITELKKFYNPTSYERKLFVSRADYNESLRLKNEIPQDFYFFRCFDVFVQIVYNKSTKFYQIYLDNFYSDKLALYERVQRSEKSYKISEDFDTCLNLFKQIVVEIINSKVLQNGLFESTETL